MEDTESVTLAEMFARRGATEREIAAVIGQLVFSYAKLTSALHYCVAWHNDGADLDGYGNRAESFSVADLINKTSAQAESRYGSDSTAFKRYGAWADKAHAARQLRNLVMHSRWGIEAYGRHAVAISTPPFVHPQEQHVISGGELLAACDTNIELAKELGALREKYPL